MWKKILGGGLLILIVVGGKLFMDNYPKLGIVSSYSAKKMCSCTFISGRSQESIQNEDLSMGPLALSSTEIDRKAKRVTSSVFGLKSKTAEYRGKLGCVLIQGEDDFNVKYPNKATVFEDKSNMNFPYGDKVAIYQTSGVDHTKLAEYAEMAFDANLSMTEKKTRSVLILHKDSLIYEQYANGYDKDTEILGWSMTKSLLNTWVGMMVKDSVLSIEKTSLFDEWKDDERKNISLNNLMQMSSGLEWSEEYAEISPATKMLYESENNGQVALEQPLEAPIGEHWEYSSGTSNIISAFLKQQINNDDAYLRFPHERIFGPLNMKSAVLETDESGAYIGSSYCYATTRDWARYGTFYLRDGVWNGERLLPEGWVDYTKTAVPDSEGAYGSQFWTNANGSMYPDAPHTMFSSNGYEGQRVFIIPSKDLIIVRLGLNGNFDFNSLLKNIISTVE